jgi:predicted transcriptional regulator
LCGLHFSKLKKEDQVKEGKLNIRIEITKTENRITTKKMDGTKSWFFKNMNKINKPLTRLGKKEVWEIITKVRKESGDITTDFTHIFKNKSY